VPGRISQRYDPNAHLRDSYFLWPPFSLGAASPRSYLPAQLCARAASSISSALAPLAEKIATQPQRKHRSVTKSTSSVMDKCAGSEFLTLVHDNTHKSIAPLRPVTVTRRVALRSWRGRKRSFSYPILPVFSHGLSCQTKGMRASHF
jgi:hypothetical protein